MSKKCKYYYKELCMLNPNLNESDELISYTKCCDTSDCKFKIKQERDYYKQIVDGCPAMSDSDCSFCEIDKQLQQLKQENEELKQEILELKDYWENKE